MCVNQNSLHDGESPKRPPEHFHSVEFSLSSPRPIYQFKLWRTEPDHVFLLVKDNSILLKHLKVGNILPMKYHCGGSAFETSVCNTQIERITNERQGRFRGHHRVELAIVPLEDGTTVQ